MLVSECRACDGCILRQKFPQRNLIPPEVGPSARLAVAEAGGENEEIEGKPLVGAAGRVMDSLWRKGGVQRDQISIANTLSCRPPSNLYPTDAKARTYCTESEGRQIVEYCYQHHLKPVLDAKKWERIDAIGAHSLEVLTGKTGIMKWRGSVLPLKGQDNPIVMPMVHPSYLMRDQSMIPVTISDIQKGIQVPPQYYNLKPTIEELEAFNPETLCADIETNRFTNQITMVGIASKPYEVIVVPFRGPYIAQLKRIFKGAKEIIGQNLIQFDIGMLEDNDIHLSKDVQIWDIMLIHHLLHPDEPHDLEYIASVYTQMQAWKHLNTTDMAFYNACDVDATIQSFRAMLPVLKNQGLLDLYKYVQVPLGKICSLMAKTGLKVDPNRIRIKREEFLKDLAELEKQLPIELQPYDKAIKKREKAPEGTLGKSGKPVKFIHVPATERVVPWDSPKMVEAYLYTKLGLPVQRHPKTKKVTTDKNALDRLFKQSQNPAVDAIRKVRSLGELIGTFLQDETENKQVAVGRIHSNFLVHGTSTGRLSSSGPNLQNIPAKARYIYVPSHVDWCFVEADFSSLENRLAAWYANDLTRLERLADPTYNEHRALASKVYNIPEAQITKDMHEYKMGKIANHGADGAMGPRKLAITHGIPEALARKLILAWKEANPQSAAWQEATGNRAAKDGIITNVFGRKRWFWCVAPETPILTTDLTWKTIETVRVGEHLIGFDENLTSPKYQESEVLQTDVINAPRFEVVTDKGTVIATPNHGWLTRLSIGVNGVKRYLHRWLTTECLKPGDGIVWFAKPWKQDNSSEAGWLAGFLDGEGTVNKQGRGDVRFAQNPGLALNRALQICKQLGIHTSEPRHVGEARFGNDVHSVRLSVDSPRSALEIVGKLPTVRLRANADCLWRGKPVWGNTNRHEVATVISIRQIDDGPVVQIATTTKTLITNGLLSHNSHSAYTEGIRFLPQSTGADICYRSMIGLFYERIGWPIEFALKVCPIVYPIPHPARLVLQVHDSLLLECPKPLVPEVVKCLKAVMTQSWPELQAYAIPAEIKVGEPGVSWAEVRPYKEAE